MFMSSIRFRKIQSITPVVDYLHGVIRQQLAKNKKVLWLVPGGSAIKVAAAVSQKLAKANLSALTVTLTDERYGPIGHKDSNWAQLKAAGFSLKDAKLQPALKGLSLARTAEQCSEMLEKALEKADYSIALAGMGADGHIFGIKPNSQAIESRQLVCGYRWDDFARLTLTPPAIRQLDEAVVYAVGEEKWPQLKALDKELSLKLQPAQLLKELKKVTIYNDHRSS